MKLYKYELIKTIMGIEDPQTLIAIYEILVNDDYDYIENLFKDKKNFKEFIEKYKGEE